MREGPERKETTTVTDTTVADTIVAQVGRINLMSISGLRVNVLNETTVDLPVGNGYSVEIELDRGWDWYTVRRIFSRSGVRKVKGEMTGIYADALSEVAYRASCFRNGPWGEST